MSYESLHKCADELEAKGWFNGTLLVAKQGEILLLKGCGMAAVEHEIPLRPEHNFRIGSITKQFTAAAVLLLQQQGLLNVHDSIDTYIPGYPNGDKITIHHLLTHTSGIPNLTDLPEYRDVWMKAHTTPEKTLDYFKGRELQFVPGEKAAYSNSGYVLLTYLIEKVSGIAYEQFLLEQVFEPFGMTDTGYDDNGKIVKHRASGYRLFGELRYDDYIDMSVPAGAGGLFSTVTDLYRWDRALMSNSVLNQQSTEQMLTPYVSLWGDSSYGYGTIITDERTPQGSTRRCVGHSGGINGYQTEYLHYTDHDVVVIAFSNVIPSSVGRISKLLASIALGDELDLPQFDKQAGQTDAAWLESLAGSYANEDRTHQLHIILEKGKLYLAIDKFVKVGLTPVSVSPLERYSIFTTEGIMGHVRFERNEGRPPALQTDFLGPKMDVAKIS